MAERKPKFWSEDEIRAFLETVPSEADDTDSECGLDFEDNEVIFPKNDNSEVIEADVTNVSSVEEGSIAAAVGQTMQSSKPAKIRSQAFDFVEEEEGPTCSTTGTFVGDRCAIKNNSADIKAIIWKQKRLQVHVNEVVFRGEKILPAALADLKTPNECFRYFLTFKFLKHLAEQTNLYARSKNIECRFVTTATELRQFIGILIYMSVFRYPSVRSYWARYSFQPIIKTMTCKRFEEIRKNIHFNDNTRIAEKNTPSHDRLYKIRPIISHFNERFTSVPMLQRLCVDEQMCPTKMAGNPIRQYMPNKPHKWGSKILALCDSNGFMYAFEVYSGAGDNVVSSDAPDLGAA